MSDLIGALVILALVVAGYVAHTAHTVPGGRVAGILHRTVPALACRITCGQRGGVDWRCGRCIRCHTDHAIDVLDPRCPACVDMAAILGIDLTWRRS